jgi:hypothetical protein
MSVSPLELLNSEDMIARMKEEFLDEGSRQAAERLFQKRYARYKTTTANILFDFAIEALKSVYGQAPLGHASAKHP